MLVAGPFALSGCGGAGGGDKRAGSLKAIPTKVVTGTIVLPTGVSPAAMKVVGLNIKSQPDANGKFQYVAGIGAPSLVGLRGSAGETVLLGLLDDSHTTLDATSTAQYLVGCPLGVGAVVPEYQIAYLKAFETSAEIPALATAIGNAIKSHGSTWMTVEDPGVESALSAALSEFAPSTAHAQSISRQEPNGVIFSPTERTSGLQIEADGIGHCTVKNFFRRRVRLYGARVSYKKRGVDKELPDTAELKGFPMKLKPIEGLKEGAVVALFNLGHREELYAETETPEIEVPVHPDEETTVYTNYTFIALGAGALPPDAIELTNEQAMDLIEVIGESIILDIVLPALIFGLIPIKQETIREVFDSIEAAPVIQDVLRTLMEAPELLEAFEGVVKHGKVWDAVIAVFKYLLKSEILLGKIIRFVSDLAATSLSKLLTSVEQEELNELLHHGIHLIVNILHLAVQIFDTLMTTSDLVRSKSVTVFKLAETKATVKLNPAAGLVLYPNTQVVKAVITDASASSSTKFVYRWHCPSTFGEIATTEGQISSPTNTVLESAVESVTYAPGVQSGGSHGLGGDQETIKVEVGLGESFESSEAVGTATAILTYKAPIDPPTATLQAGQKQTFTAQVSKNLPAGVQYEWTVNGDIGTVGGSSVIKTTANSVEFAAGEKPESGTLALRILLSNGTPLTTGEASIQTNPVTGILKVHLEFPERGFYGDFTLVQDSQNSLLVRYVRGADTRCVMYANYKGYTKGTYQYLAIDFDGLPQTCVAHYLGGILPQFELGAPGNLEPYGLSVVTLRKDNVVDTQLEVTGVTSTGATTTISYKFQYNQPDEGLMTGEGTFVYDHFTDK